MGRTRPTPPRRILIASEADSGLWELQAVLGNAGYVVERIYAGTTVPELARTLRPDLIFLDAALADRDSLALSRALRDDPVVGPSAPIILLVSTRPSTQEHLDALRAGIWELLPRPFIPHEVLARADAYMRAKAEAERIPERELVDRLTGLYTSQGLARRARDLIVQASQHNTSAACVAFAPELTGARDASGTSGITSAGLIERVAAIFKAMGRRSDGIGRIGPAQIAVFAAGTDMRGARQLAERFQRASHAGETAAGAAPPPFELRAGYDAVSNVRYTPTEPLRLLGRATRALQLAKAQGQWTREASNGP